MMFAHLLSYADGDHGVVFHHRPVKTPDREPSVVDVDGLLDGISDAIDQVDRITSGIWFLDENIQPHLSLVPPTPSTDGHDESVSCAFDLFTHIDVAPASHAPKNVLGVEARVRNLVEVVLNENRVFSVSPEGRLTVRL